jgi:hypothetical protein
VCDFGLLCVVVEDEIASAEYFSLQKEKRITRNYATMISIFRFDAAKVLNSAMRGNTVILASQRQNQSIDAENVCRGKNFNKEPRAPLNLNQMNHLSDGLNHRRTKWPSADYTQQTMSTLHHRHEWATRGEHTHAPDKSAVGVLDASTCNSNA